MVRRIAVHGTHKVIVDVVDVVVVIVVFSVVLVNSSPLVAASLEKVLVC